MLTIILLAVLFVGELVFAAWNIKTQDRHDREKMIWRLPPHWVQDCLVPEKQMHGNVLPISMNLY